MNNASKVEAFKAYYSQAKQLYINDELEESRSMFLNAASLANEISLGASSYDVRMEYHALAEKILKFIHNDFYKKSPTSVGKEETTQEDKTEFLNKCGATGEKVTFNDVAGLEKAKDEIIYNVIEPLKNPEIAKKYKIVPGAKILLYGPPGTGKTYMARAVAGEVDAVFYSVNCQDLISKYMGESSKQIEALFEEAQKNERAIIFFDEFDAVASKRENGGSVDSEMARFVASFLTKVDGFKKSDSCKMLLLIAATNRPWAIDPAMLRGGRFDIHIYIGLPDCESRKFLIEKEFSGLKVECPLDKLVASTDGLGGSDIVSACRKMRQLAYRREVTTGLPQCITIVDVRDVLSTTRPSCSEEELANFESFEKGEL